VIPDKQTDKLSPNYSTRAALFMTFQLRRKWLMVITILNLLEPIYLYKHNTRKDLQHTGSPPGWWNISPFGEKLAANPSREW
jgi:hypothetical protein